MHRFDGLPRRLADAFAMALRKDEQQFKLAFRRFLVDLKHNATNRLSVQDDPVGLGILAIDGILDSFAGNHIIAFLATIIPHPELLLGTVLERPLIVQDELLPVLGMQGNEYDFR